MKTRILILGSSGILGKNLVKNLNYKYKVFHNGLNQRKFELTKYNLLKGLVRKTNPAKRVFRLLASSGHALSSCSKLWFGLLYKTLWGPIEEGLHLGPPYHVLPLSL